MLWLLALVAASCPGTQAYFDVPLMKSAPNTTIGRACVPPYDKYPFCNTSLSLDDRIESLIGLLEPDEKTYLLVARESPKGNISRLGLPEYDWGANCIHGVQSRCGTECPTSFPCPNGLGSTFNRTAWKNMGRIIGIELRSLWLQNVGENHASNLPHLGLDCWSPNVNLVRSPRWGRNMETPGSDPLINGLFGAAYSEGLQNGPDDRYVLGVPTLKHFVANSLEGTWGPFHNITRHTDDAQISSFDLASTFYPAFRTSIEKGGALGVMCSYNAVNGYPSCASPALSNVLRKKWGFKGYVTSDSGAVVDIFSSHHYAANITQAVAQALNAGCDIESAPWPRNHPWGTDGPYISETPKAIAEGMTTEDAVDEALRHALYIRFRLGLFDPIDDQPYWKIPPEAVRTSQSLNASYLASQESLVLLRNEEQTLPFPKGKTVAVIGPHVDSREPLLGNYLGQICPDQSFNCVQSPSEAVAAANEGGKIIKATGCDVTSNDKSGFPAAIDAANQADFVVMFLGLDTSVESEGKDRTGTLGLPGVQEDLAKALVATGKPVAFVMINGGVIISDWLAQNAPALVEAWYPGFFGAGAMADVIFGNYNPGGKMISTVYTNATASKFDILNFDMSKAPGRTYRFLTEEPLFPFGFGLSYTTFELASSSSSLAFSPSSLTSSSTFNLNVKNTGDRSGDEVVMAFFKPPQNLSSSVPASKIQKQLFNFTRVHVDQGADASITFSFEPSDFMLYDADGNGVLYRGEYALQFTNGHDQTLNTTYDLTSENIFGARDHLVLDLFV
eukprot:m.174997 g.174997  ORF g.174997 m.174997 type:complete len:788 (+) comp25291_c0_seq2:67-2430(+)